MRFTFCNKKKRDFTLCPKKKWDLLLKEKYTFENLKYAKDDVIQNKKYVRVKVRSMWKSKVVKKRKVGKYATLHSATQNLLGPASDAEEYEKKGKESFIIQMFHCWIQPGGKKCFCLWSSGDRGRISMKPGRAPICICSSLKATWGNTTYISISFHTGPLKIVFSEIGELPKWWQGWAYNDNSIILGWSSELTLFIDGPQYGIYI